MLHIPTQFRQQVCTITADNVEGANRGIEVYALLEEAAAKLILAHVPKGAKTAHELRLRLAMWSARDFEGLLTRAEDQARQSASARDRRRGTHAHDAVKHRVVRSAKAGAYRKAVQHLTGSVVSYPPDQESSYAQELLPDAGRPQRVMTPRADAGPAVEDCDSPPDELFHSSPKPLAGVRFGPESAPGPSGRRPEHLRDMLACSRRRAVNRLQHALGDMQDMALTGKLPECWDWILNSRLVFLAKNQASNQGR
jgi:hypothetical protein